MSYRPSQFLLLHVIVNMAKQSLSVMKSVQKCSRNQTMNQRKFTFWEKMDKFQIKAQKILKLNFTWEIWWPILETRRLPDNLGEMACATWSHGGLVPIGYIRQWWMATKQTELWITITPDKPLNTWTHAPALCSACERNVFYLIRFAARGAVTLILCTYCYLPVYPLGRHDRWHC